MSRSVAAAAALLLVATAVVTWTAPSTQALGPVLAITPDEVAVAGFVGWLGDLDLSARGEVAGVRDDEVSDVAAVHFDDGDLEPLVDGVGIGVSGNGCTAVTVARDALQVTHRCGGQDLVVPLTVNDRSDVAVTFDGRFAALTLTRCGAACSTSVAWFDTTTGELRPMPAPAPYRAVGHEVELDIDDSGTGIVAPLTDGKTTVLARWNVMLGTVDLLTDESTGRWAAFPSLSGDGRYVAYASNQPLGLGEVGAGPWVYVRDLTAGPVTLVSAPDGRAYFSSLSEDATQVAYAVAGEPIILTFAPGGARRGTAGPPQCPDPATTSLGNLRSTCVPQRIDVAFSATPGLPAGVTTESVSLSPVGTQVGRNWHPVLSGNGRWVAWISDAADDLTGDPAGRNGLQHGVRRRRDPGLAVDAVAFPPVVLGASSVATTVVRNTGRTSVRLDEIVRAPSEFAVIGGSCAPGMPLAPGATCTVDLRATPTAAGQTNGTLIVGETGFDPVSAATALTATASPPATTTTTTSTTTTTTAPPAGVTTTTAPRVTTTTAPPGRPLLAADPTSIDFGPTPVGFASDPHTIVITNRGNGSSIVGTSLSGATPDDFWVRTNGCNGVVLAPGASCAIEVLLVPRDGGPRAGTLTVRAGSSVVDVSLTGTGTFDPKLQPSPAAITARGVTVVYGIGFPPGGTFTVQVVGADLAATGTADATGVFRAPIAAATHLVLGTYTLHVDGVAGTFADVEAPLLVGLPTFSPQGVSGPAFGNSNLIVARGNG